MRTLYKIKKGLDLTLKGEATEQLTSATQSAEYAVMPTDFPGIVPRAMVKEGDSVLAGQTLFVDKATERIHFVSPVSGTIVGVERGERRKLLRFRVKANETQEFKNFDVKNLAQASADDVKNILLESGIFAFMRQRPYDVIANPNDTPKAIFISTFIFVAPASIEFSTNSFTTDAGLSITSPAAILFIVKSSNKTIFPIFYDLSYVLFIYKLYH